MYFPVGKDRTFQLHETMKAFHKQRNGQYIQIKTCSVSCFLFCVSCVVYAVAGLASRGLRRMYRGGGATHTGWEVVVFACLVISHFLKEGAWNVELARPSKRKSNGMMIRVWVGALQMVASCWFSLESRMPAGSPTDHFFAGGNLITLFW